MVLLLGCLVLLGTFLVVKGNTSDAIYHCSSNHHQQTVNLNHTLGMWYVVEIVNHREDTTHPKGTSVVDTCPVIYLSREYHNKMSLLWREIAGEVEYKFHIPDTYTKPGFWISSGAQNGSLLNMPYRHFAGTVEITKAVGSHMVLTFCTPGTELYSVVVSREKVLPIVELRGVNRMLEHRGLLRVSVRVACKGAGMINLPNLIFILAIFVLSFHND